MATSAPALSTGAKDIGKISDNQGVVICDASGHVKALRQTTSFIIQRSIVIERPDTPPKPSLNIPFCRDRDFVDRGALFGEIHEKCSGPASRVALVGLGGVGKSQLAIAYCYQIRERFPDTWVFWVHASNAARIEEGYRDIAEQVKLPGRQDPKADIFQLVNRWLRDERKGKWTLILDNADDDAVLFQKRQATGLNSGPKQPLSAYLPQSRNGSILVTTRDKSVALKLAEESDIIPVEPMSDTHALALLEKKLGNHFDIDNTPKLAAALEFMPLAIVQAAAYIQRRAPRCSVRKYVKDFYKNDARKTSLLNHEAGNLRRDMEAKNSIIITWQISFDHIHQFRPSAANLLSLMSFFDRQGIPEALLKTQNETANENVNEDAEEDENDIHEDINNAVEDENNDHEDGSDEDTVPDSSVDEFEADIDVLRNYSLITTSMDGTTFEMHGLVQLATRKWLEAHDQLERWKQQYIKNLYAEFPTGDYENWPKCQALFPHAKSVLAQQPAVKSSLREWASILHRAAWYMWSKGSYVEAQTMALKAVETKEKVLGQEDIETLSTMGMLAMAYSDGGRWKEAEKLNVQVMEMRKSGLGAEHPNTLVSMSNFATIYMRQGRWKKAEELNVQVIEIKKKVLGAEHPNTLASMSNLAMTYYYQGWWKKAEELNVQVTEIQRKVLGAEHPGTLISMNNLALSYNKQGRWKEAEELNVQVTEIQRKVLGAEHPGTLISMFNLASTWKAQDRNDEALSLLQECSQLQIDILGPQHPDTVDTLEKLNKWQRESLRAKSDSDPMEIDNDS